MNQMDLAWVDQDDLNDVNEVDGPGDEGDRDDGVGVVEDGDVT